MNRFSRHSVSFLAGLVLILAGCGSRQDAPLQLAAPQPEAEAGSGDAGAPEIGVPAEAGTSTAASATDGQSADAHHQPAARGADRPSDAAAALATLMEGNRRFVQGTSIHPHESADYRASLAHEQHPFATVLTCSDSRVTPVLIFDQGIGDLFVIRVAGNIVDEDVAGSIEYAVDHLQAPLLVILGHEDCGAVTAAYHWFAARDLKQREPHEIESLLMRIEPAVRELDRSRPMEEQITAAVEANVRQAIHELLRLPDMQQAHQAGRVRIVGAIYSVQTGAVRLLDQ